MLKLKDGSVFNIPETGESFLTAYMRTGLIQYNPDELTASIQCKYYVSRQAFEDREPPIYLKNIVVGALDFGKWFGLDKLNSSSNILILVYNYLTNLPGVYPGTLEFGDWVADL